MRKSEEFSEEYAEKVKKRTAKLIDQTAAVVAHKQNNLPTNKEEIESSKAEIARIIAPKVKYLFYEVPKNNEQFAERANEYFREVVELQQVPMWEDFCLAMGATRQTVSKWINTENKGRYVSELCKKAREILSSMEGTLAATGKLQPVVYIFRSKNYYGMRDQAEVVVSQGDRIEHKTEEELRRQYADIIEADADIE